MKKEKKCLKLLDTDEIVKLGVKYDKLCNIFKAVKWGSFGVHCLGMFMSPANIAFYFALSNFASINIFGMTQLVFATKRNECVKILESRGELYKLTQKIEKQIDEPQKVSRVTKEEIKECGDVFPEFATNYRISVYDDKSNNNIERG